MKTIRRNTFETNSSSTHCVTICNSSETYSPITFDNTVLEVKPGEYGWEYEFYDDFEDKVSYAYTYAINDGTPEDLELLKEVILENTNIEKIIFTQTEDRWYSNGYIDHQSVDEAALIFESKDSLRNFLFNKGSNVLTDNDNH